MQTFVYFWLLSQQNQVSTEQWLFIDETLLEICMVTFNQTLIQFTDFSRWFLKIAFLCMTL